MSPPRRRTVRTKKRAKDPGPIASWSDAALTRVCRTGIPGYDAWGTALGTHRFDVRLARRAITFFHEMLVFVEGERAGEPFDLEPWQAAIVANLFGWVDRKTKYRRYREGFVFVPRKNGKTSIAAGIALYLLLCDGEPGGQVYSAAAEQSQAALIFRSAIQMIAKNRDLLARCKVYRTFKAIEVPSTGSIFRALTADAQTKHGLSVHGAIVDELHAHPSRDLVDVLQTGTGSRRQPMTVHITTSDYERISICNEKYDYARKVRDRAISDPSFLPVLYEAALADDWADPAIWKKANPNLGISVKEEYLERECARAKESPAYLNTFLRLHLNIRTNADVAALDMRHWNGCAGERAFHDLAASLEGKECYAGLDLASTEDLTALVLFFPDEGNAVLPYFWCPKEGAVTKERRHRVPYAAWARDRFLFLTEGNATDYDHVERQVIELSKRYRIKCLGFDRYGAQQVVTHLEDAGVEVLLYGQGYFSMSAPSKRLDVLVRSGLLRHGAHPVLTWNASNLMWEKDAADNWKPSKKKSREKIDGMTALIMAIGVALADPSVPNIENALLSGDGILA
jgi:phage terminase large subunit-like protein